MLGFHAWNVSIRPPAFGMLDEDPVAVEIKPVVVGASTRPGILDARGVRDRQ